jgi:hypothetical protein
MPITVSIIDKFLDIVKYFLGKKKAGDAFVDAAEILSLMKNLVNKKSLNIERVLLIKAHNDGGNVIPISYNYISIILENYREPLNSAREKFYKFPLTEPIMETIAETYVKKGISIEVDKIKEDHDLLKSLLKSDGIRYTQFHFIKHKKTALWFLSISTTKPDEKFETDSHQIEIYTAVGKIKQRIKQY